METNTTIRMRATREAIFGLAAAVERWPAILPHYRWVRVLHEDGPGWRKTVEMAARRDWFPVRWRAVQEVFPEEFRIRFRHVGGVTKGMEVEWTLTPEADGETVLVRIWHDFRPRWPVPDTLVHWVIGEMFVGNIAGKTLRRIKELAEAETRARSTSPG